MKEITFKAEIAKRLKQERKRNKLSLDATAQLTGVSKAMLGQIEREESSPTIATLWKIASGLNCSFSAFFAEQPQLHIAARIFPNDAGMKVATVFPFQQDTGIEVFEITLNDFHQQMSTAHSVGVIEHICVLQGELDVYFEQQWHRLESGESVRFNADQSHGYKAVTEQAVFHNIISYPK